MIRVCLSFFLMLLLGSCGAGDPSFVRLGDYECDASERVVRDLIKALPENVTGGVPAEFSLVKALDLRAVDSDFVQRLDDLKLHFVSRNVLIEQPEVHYPINPKSGISPVILHLRHLKKLDGQSFEVEAGWAYKKTFEIKRFLVKQTNGAWIVQEATRLDGNYDPAVK